MVVEEELQNMEAQYQEAASTPTMGPPSNDLSHNVKGKRTKRQRAPQSPVPFTITTLISSNDGDSVNTSTPEEDQIFLDSTTTKEEKDTARCLILLSQGHSHNHNIYTKIFDTTYTHKKANGKGQIYNNVYECKTCNRAFTSFQALGGHRASHTKPKAVMPNEEQPRQQQQYSLKKSCSTSSLYLQLSNNNRATFNNNHHHKSSSPRVHECAICGAEFASGQALGGHMRRHRGTLPIGSSATNTTMSFLSPLSNIMAMEENIDIHHESKKLKSGNLSLDLNLPAASEGHDENHHVGSKLYFPSKQQQQQQQLPLVLPTAPTLVNCQY